MRAWRGGLHRVDRRDELELAGQGTTVSALHVGLMDTDMGRRLDGPESDPAVIAALAVDGIEAGAVEILGNEVSHMVRAGPAGGVTTLSPQFA